MPCNGLIPFSHRPRVAEALAEAQALAKVATLSEGENKPLTKSTSQKYLKKENLQACPAEKKIYLLSNTLSSTPLLII
jgi:hypothetical protein